MVIVSMPSGTKPAAAVLYADADQFGKKVNVLLKQLNEAWQMEATKSAPSSQSPGARGHQGAAQPLRQTVFADNSGSIGLPSGWRITSAGGGAVHVAGPHGEEVILGAMFQGIYDPRSPQTRSMIDYLNKAHRPYFVYPYGGDLVKSWTTVMQQSHQRDNTPVPTFRLTGGQRCSPAPMKRLPPLCWEILMRTTGEGPWFPASGSAR
jgi:hypothetical protein